MEIGLISSYWLQATDNTLDVREGSENTLISKLKSCHKSYLKQLFALKK
jgi:hypothetical protein